MDDQTLKILLEQARNEQRASDQAQIHTLEENSLAQVLISKIIPTTPLLAEHVGTTDGRQSADIALQGSIQYAEAPPIRLSKRKWKASQPRTAGTSYFDLPAPKRTPELEKELRAMALHRLTDSKRHYRKSELKEGVGEFFALGHIVADNSRATNASTSQTKKRSFVDALLEDEQAVSFTARKFSELQARRAHRPKRSRYKRRKSD